MAEKETKKEDTGKEECRCGENTCCKIVVECTCTGCECG